MIKSYALVAANGLIVNRISLDIDENPDWEIDAGEVLVEEPASGYDIGGTLIAGVYTPVTPPSPPAVVWPKSVVACGIVRFTVVTGILTNTDDTIGVGAVTRISTGRYRIFNAEPDNDLLILPAPIIRDAADIRIRVSAKTSAFTEIKTVNAAGSATDAAEVTVMFSKVV